MTIFCKLAYKAMTEMFYSMNTLNPPVKRNGQKPKQYTALAPKWYKIAKPLDITRNKYKK